MSGGSEQARQGQFPALQRAISSGAWGSSPGALSARQRDEGAKALGALLDTFGEQKARRIVSAIGRQSALTELDRIIVQRLTVRLLQMREPRSRIRDRLMARGMSERSAYRQIEVALNVRRDSANYGPPLAENHCIVHSLQSTETQPMAKKDEFTAEMQAKLAELQEQLAKVSAKEADALERHRKADAEYQHVCSSRWHSLLPGGRLERDEIAERRKRAQNEAHAATEDARRLRRQIDDLEKLLTGDARAQEAAARLQAATTAVAEAETKLAQARTSVQTIDRMITEAEQAFADATEATGAQVLEAVRSGADASQIEPPSRSKIGALERARTLALSDVTSAEKALSQTKAHRKAVQDEIARAEADAQTLRYQAALEQFVRVFADYKRTQAAIGESAPPPRDLDARALALLGEQP